MGNIFSIRILFRNVFFIIYFVMCRRRALCSLSFFIVMILGEIFMGKNAGSVIVQKRNGKWQYRFYIRKNRSKICVDLKKLLT